MQSQDLQCEVCFYRLFKQEAGEIGQIKTITRRRLTMRILSKLQNDKVPNRIGLDGLGEV